MGDKHRKVNQFSQYFHIKWQSCADKDRSDIEVQTLNKDVKSINDRS